MGAILPGVLRRDNETGTRSRLFIPIQGHAPCIHKVSFCVGRQHVRVDHATIVVTAVSQHRSHGMQRVRQTLDLRAN
eukprot:15482156-Alexandrium_andersonii.AAC.1